jgi:acetyltransferase-like isoleucine patch superfamily enzyme
MIQRLKDFVKNSSFFIKNKEAYFLWKDSFQLYFLFKVLAGFPSHRMRFSILRMLGAHLGSNVAIQSGCKVWAPAYLTVGQGSAIGFSVNLDSRMGLNIGQNVTIASEVMIWTLHHDYNDPGFKTIGESVTINNYAWICSRSIILPGVTIGEGAVVAAGAVVTQNVDPYTIVGGVPAKKIGVRNTGLDYVPGKYKLHFL